VCGTDVEIEGWRADVEMERGGGCESSFSMLLVEKVVYLLIFSNNLW